MTLLYEELSYALRGMFFKIYNEIGPGFKEDIYARALVELLKEKKKILSYLKSTGLLLGFLVNFGCSKLYIKRYINSKR